LERNTQLYPMQYLCLDQQGHPHLITYKIYQVHHQRIHQLIHHLNHSHHTSGHQVIILRMGPVLDDEDHHT
ncbi:hypothetical protein AM593_04422, partial [Mytilus galloprovincialis]